MRTKFGAYTFLGVIAVFAVWIGFGGAYSSYYSGHSHPTVAGLLEYLFEWGSLSAICLFFFSAGMILSLFPAHQRKRLARTDDDSFVLGSDDGCRINQSLDLSFDGYYDSRSDEGGGRGSTGSDTGEHFGSAGSSISESTIFNPATGIEMDGAFDKAGNLFGHGFGE